MKTKPITYGQLADFLTELGFKPRVYDEHRVVYYHKPSDSLFVLPNCPPKTPAEEKHVGHVRFQLDWRGLLEPADFDAHFAKLTTAKS
jgi:hypothetical protein